MSQFSNCKWSLAMLALILILRRYINLVLDSGIKPSAKQLNKLEILLLNFWDCMLPEQFAKVMPLSFLHMITPRLLKALVSKKRLIKPMRLPQ